MSSVVGEDTAQTITEGRAVAGEMYESAQAHLRKVFLVFVAAFMGTFYALRLWIWDFLEATAKAEMGEHVAGQTDLITRTPFEVILLQAKIGLLIGALVALPVLLYYTRGALKRRGVQSVVPISKVDLAALGFTSFVLFWVGIAYAYVIFFPFAFDFLATNAVETGVKPSFGITEFTEFIALLTLSFGLAAQLPLFMSVLSYTEIISYETFRDKWRHAVVGITVFGALFSPPDPFTLMMWAMPLVALYVLSLGLAKPFTNLRRKGEAETGSSAKFVQGKLWQFGAMLAAVFVATVAAVLADVHEFLWHEVRPELPEYLQPAEPIGVGTAVAEWGLLGVLGVGAVSAITVGLLVLFFFVVRVLRQPVYPREGKVRRAEDPDEVDFDLLDVEGVRLVPDDVFLEMDEETAVDAARTALQEEDREKAEAIIGRYDRLQAEASEAEDETGEGESGEGAVDAASTGEGAAGATGDEGDGETGGGLASAAAEVVDPFTEEDTDEDDIGGYYYDIAFILDSLTSKMFRIVAVFGIVLGGSFFWLYQGGLGQILEEFLSRVPEEVLHEVALDKGVEDPTALTLAELIDQMDIVIALHPVEVLIFNVKVSTLAAIVAVLPMVLYYAWPAMKERGLARGDRRVFVVWGGSLLAGFAIGTYIGFFWVAPATISYLVTDAINAGMVVSYRIKSFFWLVIYLTVGVGFLFNILVTMGLFHVGGIVHYRTMLRGWRVVVVATFVFAAVASPSGILTMLVIAIPIAVTYLLGLVLLGILTLGGRLFGGGRAAEDFLEGRFDPEGGGD